MKNFLYFMAFAGLILVSSQALAQRSYHGGGSSGGDYSVPGVPTEPKCHTFPVTCQPNLVNGCMTCTVTTPGGKPYEGKSDCGSSQNKQSKKDQATSRAVAACNRGEL